MRRIRPEKKAILAEIKDLVQKSNCMMLVGYKGLTVENFSDLRKRMKKAGAKVSVVRNVFLEKTAVELGYYGVSPMLDGPIAMITGGGDIVHVSKQLFEFARDVNIVVIKGGLLDGGLLEADDIKAMSKLPSREALIGKVACLTASPLAGLVGVMKQKVCSILYVLKSLEEKKGVK